METNVEQLLNALVVLDVKGVRDSLESCNIKVDYIDT